MNYKKLLLLGLFVLPVSAFAIADPNPNIYLVGIPGIDGASLKFDSYINALYALAISVGALVAVVKIIIAGMKYMLSEVVTSKTDAIKDIQNALFGLIIVVSAYLILNTINPNLLKTDVLQVPAAIAPSGSTGSGGAGSFNQAIPNVPKTIACQLKGSSIDCTDAEKQCRADSNKKPIVVNENSTKVVKCWAGNIVTLQCKEKDSLGGDGGGMGDVGIPSIDNKYDCSAKIQECRNNLKGTPYPENTEGKFTCMTPL